MAELFPGNFVNPSYATPEQLATQRAYAAELMKRSGQDVNRPTGALGNVLNAITAGLERNEANRLQSMGAERNAADLTALISQLQAGKVDPATAARIYANPMASPDHRALIGALVTPQKVEDVAGRPGYTAPATGVQPAPINSANGPFQPGFRAPESAGSVSTVTPFPAPMPNRMPLTPTNPQGGTFGGLNFKPVGWDAPQAGGAPQAPVAGPPAVTAPAATGSRIDALAAKDRELSAEKTLTQAGATAQGEGNQEDVKAATAAPAVIKGLGLIKSTIQGSPGMTFGPTAGWSAEAKRVIANYAPGLSDEKSLAGADAVEKLNFGLASQLAKTVGGTQGELFKAIASTPGTEKSKQGTLALIDMMQQDAMKAQQLGAIYRQYEQADRLRDYPAARQKFLTENPVINPLTQRPIEMDIKAAREAESKTGTAPSGPPIGSIHNGFRFKGGNPNDKRSWEPVT